MSQWEIPFDRQWRPIQINGMRVDIPRLEARRKIPNMDQRMALDQFLTKCNEAIAIRNARGLYDYLAATSAPWRYPSRNPVLWPAVTIGDDLWVYKDPEIQITDASSNKKLLFAVGSPMVLVGEGRQECITDWEDAYQSEDTPALEQHRVVTETESNPDTTVDSDAFNSDEELSSDDASMAGTSPGRRKRKPVGDAGYYHYSKAMRTARRLKAYDLGAEYHIADTGCGKHLEQASRVQPLSLIHI